MALANNLVKLLFLESEAVPVQLIRQVGRLTLNVKASAPSRC